MAGSGDKTEIRIDKTSDWRQRFAKAYQERTLDKDIPELKLYLPRGGKVLDVGCGSGGITFGVAAAIAPGHVVGIDPDHDMIQWAEQIATVRGVENASFHVMDGLNLDFPDNAFDVAYSNTVLDMVINPVKMLTEQQRVVKKGGWVIAAGVRDWGLSPRYPACPLVDKVYDAFVRYHEWLSTQYASGRYDPKPFEGRVAASDYFDLFAGRRCPEWFSKASLSDLNLQIKIVDVQYSGAENMNINFLDFMPALDDTDHPTMERFKPIFAEGFLDKATYTQAREELKEWYQNPYAFHYRALVFAAGKV